MRDAHLNQTRMVVLLFACLCSTLVSAADWQMQPMGIQSRWAALVSPTNALPEYPRPQMVRNQWTNLNGLWQYAITSKDAAAPSAYDGHILVPYPLESALSGVQKSLRPDQTLWYQSTIVKADGKGTERTLLNFGAVDWRATVYINGTEVGTHTGGYQNFSLDITDALKVGGNDLVVKVYDSTDQGPNPHGKQTLSPGGIMYTPTSGIWQTVWLETVPHTYIESLVLTPDVDRSQLNLQVNLKGEDTGYSVEAIARNGLKVVATQRINGQTALQIKQPRLWSPDDPFLYDLQIRLLKHGKPVDEVKSYFGMRKVEIKKDSSGIERIFLNNQYTYNLGTLDQGFWPDGLYTAPTDDALKFDIQAIKAMGFNTIRKHIKVEPARWYYHCDQLGMLVWQDMVNAGSDTPEGRAEFEKESKDILTELHNYPSITTWVLFNEGWGAYDQARLTQWVKDADPSRIVNGHTGEERFDASPPDVNQKWANSDVTDIHPYPGPGIPPKLPGKARVIGEFGGIGTFVQDHVWDDLAAAGWGYVKVTPPEFAKAYAELIEKLKDFESQGLSGSIYTQPFDVEGEQNGLMTYDRWVMKIPASEMRRINARIIPTTQNYLTATKDLRIDDADLTPDATRYAAALSDYHHGNHNPAFLRKLVLMAIRQKDQANITLISDELIAAMRDPYTRDSLRLIAAITRTTHDKGFAMYRTEPERVNAVLGSQAAERAMRSIIEREAIDPIISAKDAKPDWDALEKTLVPKYGVLGGEALYGKAMIYYYEQKDWVRFGRYYARYFATAAVRSEYHINNISYEVFKYVTDRQALEAAIKADKYSLDTFSHDDPSDIDTYASLLYKAGKVQEAIEWQEKAAKLKPDDPEIGEHLKKMKAGKPTWQVT